jgi:hypothetical protein
MGKHHLRFGKRRVGLPGSPAMRIGIGILLVAGGLVGCLAILGGWLIPPGVMGLSVDIPAVRRLRRRIVVKWGRWRQSRQEKPKP